MPDARECPPDSDMLDQMYGRGLYARECPICGAYLGLGRKFICPECGHKFY